MAIDPKHVAQNDALPIGIVTYLMTDIEGSTKLWERHPDSMRRALTRHDEMIVNQVRQHNGKVVRNRGEGDSFFAVFARPSEAVAASVAIHRDMLSESWPQGISIRVRVGVHTGEADLRDGDYYGREVNRCARLRGAAKGGQTLLSNSTAELVRRVLARGLILRPLGSLRLRDMRDTERAFELVELRSGFSASVLYFGKRAIRIVLSPVWAGVLGGGVVLMLIAFVVATGWNEQQLGPSVLTPEVTANPPAETTAPSSPTPHARIPVTESSESHPGGILLQLSTVSSIVPEGKAIRFVVSMKNPGSDVRRISFPTGQLWDMYVLGAKGPHAGKELFRWSEDRIFPIAASTVEWDPREERKFQLDWTPPRLAATSLPATYRIHAVMLAMKRIETTLDVLVEK